MTSIVSVQKIISKVNINASRKHLETFMKQAASTVGSGDYVLDAGAGNHLYKTLFEHSKYHSTDLHQDKERLTFISDLTSLPIANGIYDLIVCTQVLEHVREPEVVLSEFYRALKYMGELWLTAPFYFEEHEAPNDYFRFTQFGIQHLMTKCGFQTKRLEWLEGYLGTVSYEMMKIARMLPVDPRAFGHPIFGILFSIFAVVLKPTAFLISLSFSLLDTFHKHTSSGHSKNYALVATKED
jgi:SAM-dependent methyltransferase